MSIAWSYYHWVFFFIFTLCKVSVANEAYCEISKYGNNCSSGQIVLLEKDYFSTSSIEDKIAKHCSFDYEIVELGDDYLNNHKYLCVHN